MNLIKRFFLVLVFSILSLLTVSAKDSMGFVFELGAIGSEKTFYSTSTISGDTITMPYEKTTFNPEVYVGLNIPICDLSEQCFFGIDLGYICCWNYSKESLGSSELVTYIFSHRFVVVPEFVFAKSNFRFAAGTGLAFGIEPYKYESNLSGTKYTTDYTNFKIFWTTKAGVKYLLGDRFFLLADATFFVTFFDTYDNNNYSTKVSGGSTLEILPKIGFMCMF